MCDQQYDLLWWAEPPLVSYAADEGEGSKKFEGVVAEQFFAAFQACCGGSMPKVAQRKYPSQAQMMQKIRNMTIAMPVSYQSKVIQQNDGFFLRVIESSGLAFVTQETVQDGNLILQGMETVWPLLVLILLTCGYAGLVFWISEFTVQTKHRQIDRSFFRGLFDGYWCAFITATTVGYGDKVPGSRFGKLLTIIWLLFGLGLMAAFTAAMTQLMSSSYLDLSQPITMKSLSTVGVMNGSLAQQLIIEMGLKTLVAHSFEDLHSMLENKSIKGFALGQYYCSYHLGKIDESFIVALGQSDPITTGVVYNAFCPACDVLNECMKRYLLLRSLDFCESLEKRLNHRHEAKPSAIGVATQALGDDQTYLAIMAAILAALLLVTWSADFLLTRFFKMGDKDAQARVDKVDNQPKNASSELTIT